jgi:hypothetical protein
MADPFPGTPDLARVQREAAASRDFLVGKLGWSRSVIDTSRSGH